MNIKTLIRRLQELEIQLLKAKMRGRNIREEVALYTAETGILPITAVDLHSTDEDTVEVFIEG